MKSEIRKRISVFGFVIVGILAAVKIISDNKSKMDSLKRQADDNLLQYNMMNRWTQNLQQNKTVVGWLKANNYEKVAVYGIGILSNTLIQELKSGGIQVSYGIDQNTEKPYMPLDFQVYSPEEHLPEADIVIVTIISAYPTVKTRLETKLDCPIVSLENIVYNL